MIGLRIGCFTLVRKLAEGGMGVVYVAQHERLPEIRKVIKVLLPEFAEKHDLRARFEREAAAASRLKHEHILEVDNFGMLPSGQLWLMVPFLIGKPLHDYLHVQGRLPEHRALLIMLQLLSALEHAHNANVVHRDLKPENIFVCPTDKEPYKIKLFDFGIAKLLDSYDNVHTKAGATIGTPGYMAVEQYEHADKATARSDIYAAAIIAYQLVTGELPWGSRDQTSELLYYRQKTQQPSLLGLSPGWRKVVAKGLAVAPGNRWESARAFAHALAANSPNGTAMLRQYAPDLLRDSGSGKVQRTHHNDVTLRHQAVPVVIEKLYEDTMKTRVPSSSITGLSAGAITAAASMVMNPSRWKLVVLGLIVCCLAGTTTFTLVRTHTAAVAAPPPPPPPPPPLDAGTDTSPSR